MPPAQLEGTGSRDAPRTAGDQPHAAPGQRLRQGRRRSTMRPLAGDHRLPATIPIANLHRASPITQFSQHGVGKRATVHLDRRVNNADMQRGKLAGKSLAQARQRPALHATDGSGKTKVATQIRDRRERGTAQISSLIPQHNPPLAGEVGSHNAPLPPGRPTGQPTRPGCGHDQMPHRSLGLCRIYCCNRLLLRGSGAKNGNRARPLDRPLQGIGQRSGSQDQHALLRQRPTGARGGKILQR